MDSALIFQLLKKFLADSNKKIFSGWKEGQGIRRGLLGGEGAELADESRARAVGSKEKFYQLFLGLGISGCAEGFKILAEI